MTTLADQYKQRFAILQETAQSIESQLQEYLRDAEHVDRVSARPKSVTRFLDKAMNVDDEGKPKYDDPLEQIQDQVGARIVTFYLSDVRPLVDIVKKYYRPIESKLLVPDSQWKFGYFGQHFILIVPSDVIKPDWSKDLIPKYFELQIKTLFQHAWSEANHDLGYKPGRTPLTPEAERKLAYTSAQAWGADQMFEELNRDQINRRAAVGS